MVWKLCGMLYYVRVAVAFSTTTEHSEMYGLAIGACVIVGGIAIGAISDDSLNLAVLFGNFLGIDGEHTVDELKHCVDDVTDHEVFAASFGLSGASRHQPGSRCGRFVPWSALATRLGG